MKSPGFYGRTVAALILGAGLGCAPAAWEEHHRLALDGSGRSVLLVASDLVPGNRPENAATRLRERLSAPGLTVTETRPGRSGRIEAVVTFDSIAALCDAPFLDRECAFRRTGDGGFDLAMTIAPQPTASPRPAADVEIRVRTEGRIVEHNSDGPLERGNVLSWGGPLDRFFGEGLEVRLRTDGTSVFAATTRIVLRSALIAVGIVGIGLMLLVLEGTAPPAPGARRGGLARIAPPGLERRLGTPASAGTAARRAAGGPSLPRVRWRAQPSHPGA